MRNRRPALASLLAILLLSATFAVGGRPLTILYTNDLHLRFARLESLASLIEAERERGEVLLVDGGDSLQDFRTPLAAVWGADEMIDWMNRAGYDAMAAGNHGLYWGPARLKELERRADFPFLCANLDPASGFLSPLESAVVRDVDGLRVLLAGVITRELLPYPDFPTLRYVDPIRALGDVITAWEEDVDLVVAIGHVPVAEASRIAEAVPDIDVFVTGHSHEETRDPVRVGETLIVQAGAFGRWLGRLRIDVANGSAELVGNDLLPTEKASTDIGRGLLQFIAVAVTFAGTALLVLL